MVEIDPNLDTEIGRQVLAFVQRQDVRGMSFAFSVDKYEIEYAKKKTDMDRVTVSKARLYELGAGDQSRIHPDIREVEKFGSLGERLTNGDRLTNNEPRM